MRFRVTLALCLSFALILGATVFHVRASKSGAPTIVPVDNSREEMANAVEALGNDLNPDTSTPSETLTTTDLVGRQLMSDYLSLAQSGQATEANIDTLANKY